MTLSINDLTFRKIILHKIMTSLYFIATCEGLFRISKRHSIKDLVLLVYVMQRFTQHHLYNN